MVAHNRFPRPSLVFLDGDQTAAPGCHILPGDDAPERVVFADLDAAGWPDVAARLGRGAGETIDALKKSMTLQNHHDWVRQAADELVVGSEILWQALASAWAASCATPAQVEGISQLVADALAGG
ncbi:hypothetical protein D3C86_1655460 [compost metagenome]